MNIAPPRLASPARTRLRRVSSPGRIHAAQVVVLLLGACGADQAEDTAVPEHPTYVEHIAPILARACLSCHGAATMSCTLSCRSSSPPTRPCG